MPSTRTLTRWIVAEFLGTAVLALAVSVLATQVTSPIPSLAYSPLFLPFGVGLTLFVLVATLGRASGAHFNPAVTLSQYFFKKIGSIQTMTYVVAQVLGAWVGILLSHIILGTTHVMPSATFTSSGVLAEFLGAFLLCFTIMSVVLKKVDGAIAPLAIAGSLAVGVSLALGPGGGLLNPALALGMGVYSWVYLFLPILGGMCGAAVAVIVDEENDNK